MTRSMKIRLMLLCGIGMATAAHAVQSLVSQKGKTFSPDEITQAVGGIAGEPEIEKASHLEQRVAVHLVRNGRVSGGSPGDRHVEQHAALNYQG